MKVEQRIAAFSLLADFIDNFLSENIRQEEPLKKHSESFCEAIQKAKHQNGWFTEENVRYALRAVANTLNKKELEEWLKTYQKQIENEAIAKTVGVISAGNIPLVGFHDFLCVLISGNVFVGKLSSDDNVLLPFLAKELKIIEPRFEKLIHFEENQLKNIDVVIATGSNSTARYFEHYFGKYPHIIRKNRNSAAVLTGDESVEELNALGEDIFRYFGLGCRNVSKFFVPENYDFTRFYEAIFEHKSVIENHKYANNHTYARTVYLMQNAKLLDNDFLLLKEDIGLASPVSTVFYEHYASKENLLERLTMDKENLQCIIGKDYIPFGQAQFPALSDYADGIDTMSFLLSLDD